MKVNNVIITKPPSEWGHDINVSKKIEKIVKDKKINTISLGTNLEHSWMYTGDDADNYSDISVFNLFFEDRSGVGAYLYAYQGNCYSDDFWGVKDGYVIIAGNWKKTVSFLKDRYVYLSEYTKVRDEIKKNETKISKIRKECISVKELNSLQKRFESEKDEQSLSEDEKTLFFTNVEKREKIEKLQEKNKRNAQRRNALRIEIDITRSFKFFEYNFLKALKVLEPLYISNELAVFQIDKSKSIFSYEKLDKLSTLSNEEENDEETLELYLNGYESIDFKYKESLSSSLISYLNKEESIFYDEEVMSSVEVKPAAPVKASIAASMVAAGGTSVLSQSMVIDGDDIIWKDTMVQVIKEEQIQENGANKKNRSKAFEPRMGVFNKTTREFSVLS